MASQSNGTFGAPVNVDMGSNNSNDGGGILGSLYFSPDESTILLAAETGDLVHIYRQSSVNCGSPWCMRPGFASTDGDPRSVGFNHTLWVDRGNGNATLFFGDTIFNAVTGPSPNLAYANYTSGTWDAHSTLLTKGQDPVSLLASGSSLMISAYGSLAVSSDNGATFTQNNSVSASSFAQVDSTIYASAYDGLMESTDVGATWSRVYSGNLTGQLIGNSSVLVVVSGVNNYDTHAISYRASADGGVTWTDAATIADYTSTNSVISNISLAKHPTNSHIGLVYSVQHGSGNLAYGRGCIGQGAYFVELY